jgi:small-conductance mechanosensitive channel/CRP-like cAMP-binding protein
MDAILDLVKLAGAFLGVAIVFFLMNSALANVRLARSNRMLTLALIGFLTFTVIHQTQFLIDLLAISDSAKDIGHKSTETLWWCSLSFLVIEAIEYFIWTGMFARDGEMFAPRILKQTVTVLIILATAVAITRFVFDQPVTGLIATSGVLALILGYSAQNLLGDVFAGLALNLSQSFKLGDWIVTGDLAGKVVESNWRYIKLETIFENELSIPNSVIATSAITNYTRPEKHRGVILPVLIEGGAAPSVLREFLLEAVAGSPLTLAEPEPYVAISQFQDNGVLYEAWYYTEEVNEWDANGEILEAVYHKLNRAGIKTSMSDVTVHGIPVPADPEEPSPFDPNEVVPLLRDNDLFASLHDDELNEIASDSRKLEYDLPEVILNQGDSGDSILIVESGELEVFVAHGDDDEVKVADLEDGAVIGEMARLTGDARTATVRAASDVTVFEVPSDALKPILENRPELIDTMSKMMAARQLSEERARANADTDRDGDGLDAAAQRLAGRIKEFFSITRN